MSKLFVQTIGKGNRAVLTTSKPYIQGRVKEGAEISKSLVRGKAIDSLEEIISAATNKRSLYHTGCGVKPAEIYLHWSLAQLMQCIINKYLYTTVKKK